MRVKFKQSGLSLTETTVVIAVIALLVTLSMPNIRTFFDSMGSSSGSTRAVIGTALASARAIAAREQRYAGIRFQQDSTGNQHMVFIIHNPTLKDYTKYTVPASGFCAAEGIKPVKLPETVGAMELVNNPAEISDVNGIADKTTFSVVFSPTGKLVFHNVRVLRRNLNDTVFNEPSPVVEPMFRDDYYNRFPFWKELSRNSFITYDKSVFDGLEDPGARLNYVTSLEVIYINPYTGTIISTE